MSSSEMEKSPKDKEPNTPPPTTQEQISTRSAGAVHPDWSGFQAYSAMPPNGFLASSPQVPHSYMWGVQHIMPSYGTSPHPYVAMYPPGGIYAHPSIPPGAYPFSPFAMPSPNGITEASGNTAGNLDGEVKLPEVKEKLPIKRSKDGEVKLPEVKEKLPIKRSKGSLGSLNMITGKNNELGKTSGVSADGAYSKSGNSASEDTSEASDADSQNESQPNLGSRQDNLEVEASQNGNSMHCTQNGGSNSQATDLIPLAAAGAPGVVLGPTTNLNIGMDYWSASSTIPAMRGKVPSTRDGVQSQAWLQDERELKRQRRKQSNRESARRSRLRKQTECDELGHRAEALQEENASLRSEVNRIRGENEQLLSENASLKEKLGKVLGNKVARASRNGQHSSNETT